MDPLIFFLFCMYPVWCHPSQRQDELYSRVVSAVNGEKVTDIKTSYTASDFAEDMVLKKGKKNFRKILK